MSKRIRGPQPRGHHYIAEWRKAKRLTQEQLAEKLNTTKASISRVESNEYGYTQDFLEACSLALGCHPADLLIGPPDGIGELTSILNKFDKNQLKQAVRLLEVLANKDSSENSGFAHSK